MQLKIKIMYLYQSFFLFVFICFFIVKYCVTFYYIVCQYQRYQLIALLFFIQPISEEYLGPSRISTIYNFFCKNCQQLQAVNYLRKKAIYQMFDWLVNTPLHLQLLKSSDIIEMYGCGYFFLRDLCQSFILILSELTNLYFP